MTSSVRHVKSRLTPHALPLLSHGKFVAVVAQLYSIRSSMFNCLFLCKFHHNSYNRFHIILLTNKRGCSPLFSQRIIIVVDGSSFTNSVLVQQLRRRDSLSGAAEGSKN